MRIGLLAYSSQTGLGYQTREFYKHINCEKVLIADISKLNGMPVDHSWCKEARICDGIPKLEDCEWLVDGTDLVFICENPLNYNLYELAKIYNVKVVQQLNPEFLEYFNKPFLPKPDYFALPSYWMQDKIKELEITKTGVLPVPIRINKDLTHSGEFKQFTHIIGRPTANDRNGTLNFLEAALVLGKPYRYRIFLQTPRETRNQVFFEPVSQKLEDCKKILGDSLEIVTDIENNEDMYRDGDVLVLPRRYGGLCLPMQEALSYGIPVVMTDVSPNSHTLPQDWLVESKLKTRFQTQTEILVYDAITEDLCEKMLSVEKYYASESSLAHELANSLSWDNQKSNYLRLFRELCA